MLFRGVPISSSQVGVCTETQVVQRSTKIVHGGTDCAQGHGLCIEAPDCVQRHRGLCTGAWRELCDNARGTRGPEFQQLQ